MITQSFTMNAAISATMDAAIDAILTSNPALWRPGGIYTFEIAPNQLPPSSPTEREAKIGFSGMPPRRKREWRRQCRPQQQEWKFYYHVPDARRFEALIHLHFRLHGAWIPPKRCEFCGVRHKEKFNLARCGEMDGIIAAFEYYLWRLNWLSIRQVTFTLISTMSMLVGKIVNLLERDLTAQRLKI
ncbi:hypothetical protein B0H17DRAFT_1200452 [Mycena rosella]|uniref:Bacteriophage T5 Orf172 DNA-binding domain-containing protein n=1 Tax=Mycena rosella TaxID=1033263 RepID=A0AAD7DIF1_MYCRO|nr:hypothetical protein B0H17DRAFT_1200452 [Mycena rosella]